MLRVWRVQDIVSKEGSMEYEDLQKLAGRFLNMDNEEFLSRQEIEPPIRNQTIEEVAEAMFNYTKK
jgi:hypothetical protein